MKKVGILIAALSLIALGAGPATAAAPKTKADITVPCKTGKKKAQVWLYPFSANNPCGAGQWLVIYQYYAGDESIGDDNGSAYDVQPGAHMNTGWDMRPNPYECGDGTDTWTCQSVVSAYVGQGDWCNTLPAGHGPEIYYRKNTKWHAPECPNN